MLPAITSPGSSLTDARPTLSENIQVYIRIRPLVDREIATSNVASIRALDGQTIEVKTSDTTIKCKYDAIFDSHCTQADIYDRVKECTTVFLDGFNSTLFAYGQTGSGKSYTMFGIENDSAKYKLISKQSNQAGVIPRAVKDIFAGIARFSSDDGSVERNTQATLFCSFVQIYNEHVYDLLRDERMENPLEIVEDRKNGMYVNGISEYAVHTMADCMHLLRCGEQFRAIRSTHMNQVSSRSHSVFQLLLEQRKVDGTVLKSKLNLVDLAGSEKWNMDSQMLDHHVAEMTNINLSLHTLGRCIAALSSAKQGSTHIPYRDSKLTRLLQDSLGGNTKTKIIATLSPSLDCIDESISTLKFADRAKQVMISARINEQKVISPEYVAKLEKQIVHLRELVALLQSSSTTTEGLKEESNENGFDNDSETQENKDDSSIAQRLVESMQRNADLTQQHEELRKQIDQLKTCAQPNAVIPVAETTAILAKERLESILRQLRKAFDRFFKYEIEEEELRTICGHLFSGIPSEGIRRKIQPKGSDNEAVSSSGGMRKPLVRIRTTTSSPSTPTASGKIKRPTEIMYRMRNRTLSDQVMHSDSDGPNSSSKDPEKVLEMSQRALAKQAKLQAWYIEKEKRELSKLQHEQELMEAQRQMMRSRDEKFLKHAAATKKKLLERRRPSSQV